ATEALASCAPASKLLRTISTAGQGLSLYQANSPPPASTSRARTTITALVTVRIGWPPARLRPAIGPRAAARKDQTVTGRENAPETDAGKGAGSDRKEGGGPSRNRTGVNGFAVRCVTTPPSGPKNPLTGRRARSPAPGRAQPSRAPAALATGCARR